MTAWRLVTLVVTFALAGAAALAQPPMGPGKVSVSVEWSHSGYEPGGRGALAVVLDIEPRWHIYPGKGSPEEPQTYIPTTVDVVLPAGWTQGAKQWPKAHKVLFGPPGAQELLDVYEGRALVFIPFTTAPDAAPGEHSATLIVGYQACDDMTCDLPRDETTSVSVRIVEPGAAVQANASASLAAAFEAAMAAADWTGESPTPPGDGAGGSPDAGGEGAEPDAGGEPGPIAPASGAAAPAPRRTFFGIPLPEEGGGLLNLLVLASLSALGGFILNLTPCVLPVIPIKIMTIMQHANHPGRSLVLGIWMALGVVAFWSALGVPVAFFSGVTDPSRLFGIWWLTLGIGLVIALMGVGIMGLFTIQLPQSVYAVNPRADSAWGSFVFGVMTGVLGLPCFGFVAGALLVGVAAMPPATIMTIFSFLGLGMALPYIVLSANPRLLERLPRTGPASELVKQVMGLLLLAAAAFFIGAGLNALVHEKPYLGHELRNWAIALFCGLAGIWLIVRTFQITSRPGPRLAFTLTGIFIGGLALLYALDSTASAREDWQTRQNALARGEAAYIHGVWNEWTPEAFDKARADGKIVALDFTADWCLNCKVIKATVLNKDPVKSELNSDDVVKFIVDLTSTTAPGNAFLAELGQTGIPLLAIYTPGKDEPWLSNWYTSQQVMDAIAAARDNRLAGP